MYIITCRGKVVVSGVEKNDQIAEIYSSSK